MSHIAIFIPSLRGGGAERIMVTLANAFVSRGFSVDLVLASAEGPYLSDINSNVRVIDLAAGRTIKSLWPLARYLRQERPAAMLSAMAHANVTALLARTCALVRTRVVVSEHNITSLAFYRKKKLAGYVTRWLMRRVYKYADAICSISNYASEDLAHFLNLPINRIRTIYNPFDLLAIEKKSCQLPVHPWFFSSEIPVLLAIGRLIDQKGFVSLIKAFAQVRKNHVVRLMILGEGEQRSYLQSFINEYGFGSDEVQMPGFVENPFSYLSRCAAFVLSSQSEGFGNVLVEAMACGAAIISTDCPGGPREILQNGRWGRLVPVGDVEALAHVIADVLDTPPERLPDVRRRAWNFEQNRAVDAYLDLLGLPHEVSE